MLFSSKDIPKSVRVLRVTSPEETNPDIGVPAAGRAVVAIRTSCIVMIVVLQITMPHPPLVLVKHIIYLLHVFLCGS